MSYKVVRKLCRVSHLHTDHKSHITTNLFVFSLFKLNSLSHFPSLSFSLLSASTLSMAPMKLRQSETLPSSSQDARILVRETMRISANLASAPPPSMPVVPPTLPESKNLRLGLVEDEFIDSSLRLICCEEIDGRRWKYVAENDSFGNLKKGSIRSVSLHTPLAPADVCSSIFFF